jgi:hypothetical protein
MADSEWVPKEKNIDEIGSTAVLLTVPAALTVSGLLFGWQAVLVTLYLTVVGCGLMGLAYMAVYVGILAMIVLLRGASLTIEDAADSLSDWAQRLRRWRRD